MATVSEWQKAASHTESSSRPWGKRSDKEDILKIYILVKAVFCEKLRSVLSLRKKLSWSVWRQIHSAEDTAQAENMSPMAM